MTTATLRPMRWWDIDAVLDLERELFADPWTGPGFWSELAGVPATRTYLVAADGDRLVGYVGLFASGDAADIQTLAVRTDQQRRGLGGQLLEAALGAAADRGAFSVLLEVRADNDAALRLYEAAGFERLSLRRGYYGSGIDAVVMRKRLT